MCAYLTEWCLPTPAWLRNEVVECRNGCNAEETKQLYFRTSKNLKITRSLLYMSFVSLSYLD